MAYDKQIWDTSSVFNPTRMNHIEDGIANAQHDYIQVLATSTGSKTHAQHIATLKAVWDSLNNNQKTNCKITRGNTIYYPMDIVSGAGRFSMTIIDSQKMYIEMLRMSDTSFQVISGTTYQDLSNQTANQTYTLFI